MLFSLTLFYFLGYSYNGLIEHAQVGCIIHLRHSVEKTQTSSKSPFGRVNVDHSIGFLRFSKQKRFTSTLYTICLPKLENTIRLCYPS